MTLEQQCVSLELAKRLKELGVKQESYFFYRLYKDNHNLGIKLERFEDRLRLITDESYSAFTVAELGEMLPSGSKSFVGSTSGDAKNWVTEWWEVKEWDLDTRKFADSEANARAKMLIYLLENKLIDNV